MIVFRQTALKSARRESHNMHMYMPAGRHDKSRGFLVSCFLLSCPCHHLGRTLSRSRQPMNRDNVRSRKREEYIGHRNKACRCCSLSALLKQLDAINRPLLRAACAGHSMPTLRGKQTTGEVVDTDRKLSLRVTELSALSTNNRAQALSYQREINYFVYSTSRVIDASLSAVHSRSLVVHASPAACSPRANRKT
ncbi:unnamed protein product, partial [Ectocarpus sp. 12 AP-2014]